MQAAKLILKCLEKEGVKKIFGYPGGAVLPLYEALRESSIHHVLVRNEQAAPHYASGYARESGAVGVCLATSGPGATNLVTGIATAYLDSIPIVAITGQVNRNLIGSDAFQEADIFGATSPFTKHSYLVKDAREIPRIIKEAFHIAATGRPGPVLIDIPRDVQEETVSGVRYPEKVNIPGYKPTYEGHSGQIKRAIKGIHAAKRPVIYCGGGVILSHAEKEILAFAEKTGIPVITTLMGIGAFPEDHPLYCGIVGSHGFAYANQIMAEADLCICVGARMSDRGTNQNVGSISAMRLIHIDIDPAEIGKNIGETTVAESTCIPIVGDAKTVLSHSLEQLTGFSESHEQNMTAWRAQIAAIKAAHPVQFEPEGDLQGINPKKLMQTLSQIADKDATLVADVGLNQIWAALYFEVTKNRHYFTSGGLGTMGYSLPAASGAAFATEDMPKAIFCVCGDGSFQMSMGELAVVAAHHLPVKILLINNHKLGMVRQLQHDAYGKGHYSGTDIDFAVDFLTLAKAYAIPAWHVETNEEAAEAMQAAIALSGPALIECMVHEDFLQI